MKASYNRYDELLKEREINSYHVSKSTGIHQSTLSDWKTGRSAPKIDKLYLLSKFFEVSLDYFIEEVEDRIKAGNEIA